MMMMMMKRKWPWWYQITDDISHLRITTHCHFVHLLLFWPCILCVLFDCYRKSLTFVKSCDTSPSMMMIVHITHWWWLYLYLIWLFVVWRTILVLLMMMILMIQNVIYYEVTVILSYDDDDDICWCWSLVFDIVRLIFNQATTIIILCLTFYCAINDTFDIIYIWYLTGIDMPVFIM